MTSAKSTAVQWGERNNLIVEQNACVTAPHRWTSLCCLLFLNSIEAFRLECFIRTRSGNNQNHIKSCDMKSDWVSLLERYLSSLLQNYSWLVLLTSKNRLLRTQSCLWITNLGFFFVACNITQKREFIRCHLHQPFYFLIKKLQVYRTDSVTQVLLLHVSSTFQIAISLLSSPGICFLSALSFQLFRVLSFSLHF